MNPLPSPAPAAGRVFAQRSLTLAVLCLAALIGATLGGLLIAAFSWRSVFLLVVPLGLAALLLAVPAIPESADSQGRRFDLGAQALGGRSAQTVTA